MRISTPTMTKSALAATSALALAAGLMWTQPIALAAPVNDAAATPAQSAPTLKRPLVRRDENARSWNVFFSSTEAARWTQPVAITAPPARDAAAAPTPSGPTLKRLPAGHDELVFRGENATRSWNVFLSPTEATRISTFQLAMLNAVVVLPDRSSLRLTINGHTLPALPVRSPDKATNALVKIPVGVLTPGMNRVQVSFSLAHRVDCSVNATYELWALLDPVKTGFITDGAVSSVRTLDDVAAEPLSEDGATRIHVRMPDAGDPESIARAARLVDAFVRRIGVTRPVVDLGPDAGQGPGFDIAMVNGSPSDAALGDIRVLGRDGGVTLGRDPATNRLILVLSGADDGDLDTQIAALAKTPSRFGAARASGNRVAIETGGRKTFAQLGLPTDSFSGRHYMSSVDVTLPPDFYPASYAKSRLLIDGGHSSTLDRNGELIFRVNGAIASSLPLAAGEAEQFAHKPVELPLRYFHSGNNQITIEGITSSLADQQCDLANLPRDARLTIAGSSELEFPDFAHLGTLPQIPGAIANAVASGHDGKLNLYLPDLDRTSVATALTLLANMAAAGDEVGSPILHLEPPTASDVPGIVIGSLDQLPNYLATPLRNMVAPLATADNAAEATALSDASSAKADAPTHHDAGFKKQFDALLRTGGALADSRDFLFPANDRQANALPLPEHFLLVGAVDPVAGTKAIGEATVPQFARDASQWLVVTAASPDAYAAGVDRLVVDGQWSALAGQAVSLDLDTGELRSAQPPRVTYVAPTRFVLSDIRPILGGILSDNILLSFGGLIALVSLLGLSTHALIRRMGVR